MSPAVLEWDGDEIEVRAGRAIGRAVIGIGEHMAVTAKEIVHVETGTLRRSIHVAQVDAEHMDDEALAHGVGPPPDHTPGVYTSEGPGSTIGLDLDRDRLSMLTADSVLEPGGHAAVVEVGSWIAYACVEETGRHHYFIQPAVELVSPTGFETIQQAFLEEGLA